MRLQHDALNCSAHILLCVLKPGLAECLGGYSGEFEGLRFWHLAVSVSSGFRAGADIRVFWRVQGSHFPRHGSWSCTTYFG